MTQAVRDEVNSKSITDKALLMAMIIEGSQSIASRILAH